MNQRCGLVVGLSILVIVALVGLAPPTSAIVPNERVTPLQDKEFFEPELYISSSHVELDAAALTERSGDTVLGRFQQAYGEGFQFFMDPRSGTLSNMIGRVPLIPGKGSGNDRTLEQLAADLGYAVDEVNARVVGDLVRAFVVKNADLLGINAQQLGPTRAVPVAGHLWQISIPQQVDGVRVRYGRVLATINHGNLVLVGTESWGNAQLDTQPSITGEQAQSLGFVYAGGRASEDKLWQKPTLEIVPFAPPEHQSGEAFAGRPGQGYGHRLVWSFGFHRPSELGRWEILVDARSGQIVSFEDSNLYAEEKIQGGIYPLTSTEICPTNQTCGEMQGESPMPFADTGQSAPNDFANSAGLFDFEGGEATTTLDGKYVRIDDRCGDVLESTTEGTLDLGGVNGDHDCDTAGDSAGNTASARSCFYELNKLIELARGWLPGNAYLTQQITANVNISDTCNANYDYTNVNFFKTGGGCRNTGEIAAVFDHEWGHALDDNDAMGAMSSSSEAYADVTAIYRLHTSCVGHGFWHTNDKGCGMTADGTGYNANESQNGVHCDLDCSGVRDADWAKHEGGIPDTPQNFVCGECYSGGGPCGRQVHCSAAPSRQAAWDLVTRDLVGLPYNYDSNTAFILGNKLFYQGSGNIGSWHACTCPDSSNGCGATNAYMQWLAADDDNGDLQDGTPHMTALYQAFNRHNIACDTPAPVNGGCAAGPGEAPDVTLVVGSNQLEVQWVSVPGATRYRVLRTEGFAGCDFGKTLIATVAGNSYVDADVANGREYSYVVQGVGFSDACSGVASACVSSTPQPCSGTVSLDREFYNCEDVLTIGLEDGDLAGAGTQTVTVQSDTETSPETVTLVELPGAPGSFSGSLPTTGEPPASGDGVLSVSDGDELLVQYVDVSYCGIPDVPVNRPATIDCVAPAIYNVRTQEITGMSAKILWDTSELADSGVVYDQQIPPVAGMFTDDEAVLAHALELSGLSECSLYHFSVLSSDLAENATEDTNSGVYYSFETGKNVTPDYTTLEPPVSITDNSTSEQSIFVTDEELVVDVNVQLFLTHTYTGDLELSLIGPDGTEVVLSDRHGGSGNDFLGTIFDDQADTAIANGTAPYEGSYRPDELLSVFADTLVTGQWRLRVQDHAGGDTGSLDSWSLILTYPPKACGPHLKHETYLVDDSCSGFAIAGSNSRVEPAEDILFNVKLRNDGTDGTTDVTARLSTSTPGITITKSWTQYPDLAAGEAADTPLSPFAFTVDANVPCGTAIQFTIDAMANEGEWSDGLSLIVGETSLGSYCDSCFVPLPGAVPSLGWSGTESLQWAPASGAKFYHLYRGAAADLPNLVDETVDSCKRLTTAALISGDVLDEAPGADAMYWYLVCAGNGGGEGASGDGSAGPRIVNAYGVCP